MTTIITYQSTGLTSIASELGARTINGAAAMKKRASMSLRKIVAIALFAVGALLTLSSTVNLTLAKARQASARKVKGAGQFRLLTIYNTLRTSHPGFIETMNRATSGLASWYGGIFHGRKTAMGTRYNMYAMTAAHRSLPLGTWVRVTNQQNGKSVVVQVTDRGPYVANRIMDLSYAAAQKLGYANAGTTHISMKVLGTNPDATEVADAMPAASSGSGIETASVIPALFDVSARSFNVNMPVSNPSVSNLSVSNNSTDGVSNLLTAVTDLVSGSPSQAVAEMFA